MALIELDETRSGERAAAAIGDELMVTLEETPTSGYRWVLDAFDESVLAPLGSAFQAPPGDRLGAVGRRRFRFAVVGLGTTALTLVNRRSWEQEPEGRRFEMTIDARSG